MLHFAITTIILEVIRHCSSSHTLRFLKYLHLNLPIGSLVTMVKSCILKQPILNLNLQTQNSFMMYIFVCNRKIRLKRIHLTLAMETPLVLTLFFRGSDSFTGTRWFLHATHVKTLWSSSLSLILKISAKLAQLKCCNHDAMLLLSNYTD